MRTRAFEPKKQSRVRPEVQIMNTYNPLEPPDVKEWLELDPQERLTLVEQYHKKARVVLPNRVLHATMHTVVENQLAEGIPVVQEALSRLMADGLDRHDAIHAIASVLSEHIWRLLRNEPVGSDPNEPYFQAVRALTAKQWLESEK
jgi:hypothetical protein